MKITSDYGLIEKAKLPAFDAPKQVVITQVEALKVAIALGNTKHANELLEAFEIIERAIDRSKK